VRKLRIRKKNLRREAESENGAWTCVSVCGVCDYITREFLNHHITKMFCVSLIEPARYSF